MVPRCSANIATALFVASTGQPALAQDRAVAFSVTAGAIAQPEYFGADTFRFSPTGRIGFTGLRVGDV
jgi:hypothetical protein